MCYAQLHSIQQTFKLQITNGNIFYELKSLIALGIKEFRVLFVLVESQSLVRWQHEKVFGKWVIRVFHNFAGFSSNLFFVKLLQAVYPHTNDLASHIINFIQFFLIL